MSRETGPGAIVANDQDAGRTLVSTGEGLLAVLAGYALAGAAIAVVRVLGAFL